MTQKNLTQVPLMWSFTFEYHSTFYRNIYLTWTLQKCCSCQKLSAKSFLFLFIDGHQSEQHAPLIGWKCRHYIGVGEGARGGTRSCRHFSATEEKLAPPSSPRSERSHGSCSLTLITGSGVCLCLSVSDSRENVRKMSKKANKNLLIGAAVVCLV